MAMGKVTQKQTEPQPGHPGRPDRRNGGGLGCGVGHLQHEALQRREHVAHDSALWAGRQMVCLLTQRNEVLVCLSLTSST